MRRIVDCDVVESDWEVFGGGSLVPSSRQRDWGLPVVARGRGRWERERARPGAAVVRRCPICFSGSGDSGENAGRRRALHWIDCCHLANVCGGITIYGSKFILRLYSLERG